MPNSSAATANTKSVWLSGRMRLMVPSPGPRPNQPPRMKRFGGDVDVEGVAGGRIEEALDAPRHVRHGVVGAGQADGGRAGEPDHPDEPHAGHEEQRAPHQRDQHGLAEVGLQHQQPTDSAEQRERERCSPAFPAGAPIRRTARRPGSRRRA